MHTNKRRKLEESSPTPSNSEDSFASFSEEDAHSDHSTLPVKSTSTSNGARDGASLLDTSSQAAPSSSPSFADLGVIPELTEACQSLHFTKPTPIQSRAIPLALEGRDIIGLAETGSGKTAAFALPILQDLLANEIKHFALVLAPTRELAVQTKQQFDALGKVIGVKTCAIVGGVGEVQQAIELMQGPHVIVATPGRLMYHLENTKGFHLRSLKYLVMDEADRLLDLNFGREIDRILRELPKERRTYLFSATMSAGVASLQRASLRHPVKVAVENGADYAQASKDAKEEKAKEQEKKPKHTTVATLQQHYLFRPHKDKDSYLIYLLTTTFAGSSCIVFARTIHEVNRLTHLLRALGLAAIPLHGELNQSSRLGALNKFKAHARDILVATDVAARGLDIPSVDLVLNYDLPQDDTTYVHRVGRTARAGKSGVAVSFVSQYDVEVWMRIEKALGKKLGELPGMIEEEVLVLSERVGEGQRQAVKMLKEEGEKRKGKRGKTRGKRKDDERDLDEG
ncbi:MAG: hypothetical protein Q9159_007049 [Coniocarpon cinnabarinum]